MWPLGPASQMYLLYCRRQNREASRVDVFWNGYVRAAGILLGHVYYDFVLRPPLRWLLHNEISSQALRYEASEAPMQPNLYRSTLSQVDSCSAPQNTVLKPTIPITVNEIIGGTRGT